MEQVIYQNQGGLGVILDFFEEESDYFIPKELVVNNELLVLDKPTTLSDFFSEEVIFKGVLKDKPNCMVFCK